MLPLLLLFHLLIACSPVLSEHVGSDRRKEEHLLLYLRHSPSYCLGGFVPKGKGKQMGVKMQC